MRRELIYFGLALVFGLVFVPVLTWFVGSRVLGPYSRGTDAGAAVHNNALALLSDFFAGLAHGYVVFWVVALGPAVFLILIRLIIVAARRTEKTAAS